MLQRRSFLHAMAGVPLVGIPLAAILSNPRLARAAASTLDSVSITTEAMMTEAGVDPETAHAIAEDYVSSGLDERTRAMLDFALTERPDLRTRADVDEPRRLGFEDRQILEMIVVAGFLRDDKLRVSIFGPELEDWTKGEG